MNSKKWIKIWIFTVIISIITITGFNYLIDPMWLFSHKIIFNQSQDGFNERQQKTNSLQFRSKNTYNGVLLGSSRSTFINQNDFIGMNVFNYSFRSMEAFEYIDYIEFFKKKQKKLDYIIIGADFYNTNTPKNIAFEMPKYYINNSMKFNYRFTTLLSKDTLKYSFKNIKNYFNFRGEKVKLFYDRENIKYRAKASEQDRIKAYTANIKRHTKDFIGKEYKYNDKYISILNTLKDNNPSSKIIIFTSPISANLLVSIIKNGDKMKEYRNWLDNLTTVFGSIYHFMDINSITSNLENYPDDDHYYPDIGKLVANRISGVHNLKIPDDFGLILNKDNLSGYLEEFEKKINLHKKTLQIN